MGIGDIAQFIGVIFIFFLVLYGAYFVTKYAANFQSRVNAKGNLSIVEAISVGPQKSLQLIRVGNRHMLIGVTKDQVTFLSDINADELVLRSETLTSESFGDILGRFTKRTKNHKVGEDKNES